MIFGFVWYSCGEKIKRWRRDERDLFRVLTRGGGGGSHRKRRVFWLFCFPSFSFLFSYGGSRIFFIFYFQISSLYYLICKYHIFLFIRTVYPTVYVHKSKAILDLLSLFCLFSSMCAFHLKATLPSQLKEVAFLWSFPLPLFFFFSFSFLFSVLNFFLFNFMR